MAIYVSVYNGTLLKASDYVVVPTNLNLGWTYKNVNDPTSYKPISGFSATASNNPTITLGSYDPKGFNFTPILVGSDIVYSSADDPALQSVSRYSISGSEIYFYSKDPLGGFAPYLTRTQMAGKTMQDLQILTADPFIFTLVGNNVFEGSFKGEIIVASPDSVAAGGGGYDFINISPFGNPGGRIVYRNVTDLDGTSYYYNDVGPVNVETIRALPVDGSVKIDFSALSGTLKFIGSNAFSGTAGEMRVNSYVYKGYSDAASRSTIEIDTNGDKIADRFLAYDLVSYDRNGNGVYMENVSGTLVETSPGSNILVATGNSLFTSKVDTVDFNALTLQQMQAIADGQLFYDGKGGSDSVTLPNRSNYNANISTSGSIKTLGWTEGREFFTNDRAGDLYVIQGGDGSDRVQLGAGKSIIYGSPGSDTIKGGAGQTTFDFAHGAFKGFSGFAGGTVQTLNAASHAFRSVASEQNVLILPGSASNYGFEVSSNGTFPSGGDWASTQTSVFTLPNSGLAAVRLETRGIERVAFADTRITNQVELKNHNLFAEAAQLADESYGSGFASTSAARIRGWHAVSAMELGIAPISTSNGATQYTFANGLFQSLSSISSEADATVLTGIVGGKQTLAVTFRGTDDTFLNGSDVPDWLNPARHYQALKPLTGAVLSYVKTAGIEKVLISGHSLGGAMAQLFTAENIGVYDVNTFTFGSPGADQGNWSSSTSNFIHTLDPVPPAGGLAGYLQAGGRVYMHSVEASRINPLSQHDMGIYVNDTRRLVDFANDPLSPLWKTALGESVTSNTPYTGPDVQIMLGTDAPNYMFASSADNYILGGAGKDVIYLNSSNLIAAGVGGQRFIDGGIESLNSNGDTLNVAALSFDIKTTVEGFGKIKLAMGDKHIAEVTNIETIRFLNGTSSNTADDFIGKIYALYDGLLGREGDAGGLEHWAGKMAAGMSVRDIAQNFLSSHEGQSRAGAADNATFVDQLYQANLQRASDPGGSAYWTAQLDGGALRADVAIGFALSDEHISNLKSVYDAGIFVPDSLAAGVARIYYTMLARAPDADGLSYWRDQIDQGGTLSGVTAAFLGTPENQSKYGSMANSDYVDALYVNALGRHADSGGQAYWTNLLNQGASRADLGTLLAQSEEAKSVHLNEIELGWHLA